jgi:hypothetical protein
MVKEKLGFKISDGVLALLFLVSMGLAVWGINIYRLTIIPITLLITIITIGSIPAFLMIFFLLKPSYKIIWILLTSIAIGGSALYFSFLYLNATYCDNKILTNDFNILRKGTLAAGKGSGACRTPFIIVDFNGSEKQLVFYCDYKEIVDVSSKVRIGYSRGLFGFDVIKSRILLK